MAIMKAKRLYKRKSKQTYIYDGEEDEGFAWAGQVMGLIKDVPTVEELFTRMIQDAEKIREKWARITVLYIYVTI